MKKLSEQIATLTERLEELRHSAADIPRPSNSGPVTLPKAPASKK